MKKRYIHPTIDIICINNTQSLLTGSNFDTSNPTSGDAGDAASPSFFFDYDE